jgi:hypothetical protein
MFIRALERDADLFGVAKYDISVAGDSVSRQAP